MSAPIKNERPLKLDENGRFTKEVDEGRRWQIGRRIWSRREKEKFAVDGRRMPGEGPNKSDSRSLAALVSIAAAAAASTVVVVCQTTPSPQRLRPPF